MLDFYHEKNCSKSMIELTDVIDSMFTRRTCKWTDKSIMPKIISSKCRNLDMNNFTKSILNVHFTYVCVDIIGYHGE